MVDALAGPGVNRQRRIVSPQKQINAGISKNLAVLLPADVKVIPRIFIGVKKIERLEKSDIKAGVEQRQSDLFGPPDVRANRDCASGARRGKILERETPAVGDELGPRQRHEGDFNEKLGQRETRNESTGFQ